MMNDEDDWVEEEDLVNMAYCARAAARVAAWAAGARHTLPTTTASPVGGHAHNISAAVAQHHHQQQQQQQQQQQLALWYAAASQEEEQVNRVAAAAARQQQQQQQHQQQPAIPLGYFRDPRGQAWAASLQHPFAGMSPAAVAAAVLRRADLQQRAVAAVSAAAATAPPTMNAASAGATSSLHHRRFSMDDDSNGGNNAGAQQESGSREQVITIDDSTDSDLSDEPHQQRTVSRKRKQRSTPTPPTTAAATAAATATTHSHHQHKEKESHHHHPHHHANKVARSSGKGKHELTFSPVVPPSEQQPHEGKAMGPTEENPIPLKNPYAIQVKSQKDLHMQIQRLRNQISLSRQRQQHQHHQHMGQPPINLEADEALAGKQLQQQLLQQQLLQQQQPRHPSLPNVPKSPSGGDSSHTPSPPPAPPIPPMARGIAPILPNRETLPASAGRGKTAPARSGTAEGSGPSPPRLPQPPPAVKRVLGRSADMEDSTTHNKNDGITNSHEKPASQPTLASAPTMTDHAAAAHAAPSLKHIAPTIELAGPYVKKAFLGHLFSFEKDVHIQTAVNRILLYGTGMNPESLPPNQPFPLQAVSFTLDQVHDMAVDIVTERHAALHEAVRIAYTEVKSRYDEIEERRKIDMIAHEQDLHAKHRREMEALKHEHQLSFKTMKDMIQNHRDEVTTLKQKIKEIRLNQDRSLTAYMKASVHSLRLLRKTQKPNQIPDDP